MTAFFDIPKEIRLQIYRFCNIVRVCPIDLAGVVRRHRSKCNVVENSLRLQESRHGGRICGEYTECWTGVTYMDHGLHSPLPVQLLRVCRVMCDEITPILYGENVFKIKLQQPLGAENLANLNQKALKSLRYFHIRLHKCDAPKGRTASYESLLERLEKISRILAANVPPFQMKFSFESNFTDSEMIQEVISFLKYLPKMKDCAVSLLPYRNKELSDIAKKVALDLMGCSITTGASSESHFPFNRLPEELQILILSNTDLVMPLDDTNRGVVEFEGRRTSLYRSCCRECISSLESCCCPGMRAAFSGKCICPEIPSPLFVLSHQMLKKSQDIFFSQNRFIPHINTDFSLKYFSKMPLSGLGKIRILDLAIGRDADGFENWKQHWIQLVEFISNNLDLARLWLTVDAGIHRKRRLEKPHDIEGQYRSMMKPLQRLEGLQKFHVLLS